MNFLISLLIGAGLSALVWFVAYESVVTDFKPDSQFFYTKPAHVAFSASTGIAGMFLFLILNAGGPRRRRFKTVKDKQGKVIYDPNRVLQIGSRTWNEDEFCGHMSVTGASGFGKTVFYMAALASLIRLNPKMGGVVIDAKGDILPGLKKLLEANGRIKDLIVIDAKNPARHPNWKPANRINLIGDSTLPYTVRAKLLADSMASMTSGNDNPFFQQQGPDFFAQGMELLDNLGEPVTISSVAALFADVELLEAKVSELEERALDNPDPQRIALLRGLRSGLLDLKSDGQRDGILGSVRNLVSRYLTPGIKEVFSSELRDTFSIEDVDKGKIIVLSISQEFTGERKAVFSLMKLAAYRHGKRRFDDPSKIKDLNIVTLFFDEFQNYVTSSDDGETDFSAIDQLRSAKMPIIAGTQSTTSLIPAFGNKEKAKTFLLNCTNNIIFRSADEDCSKLSADTLGKREQWKKSYSAGGGKGSVSKTKEEQHRVKPHVLRSLKKLTCYINHVSLGLSKVTIKIPKEIFEKR